MLLSETISPRHVLEELLICRKADQTHHSLIRSFLLGNIYPEAPVFVCQDETQFHSKRKTKRFFCNKTQLDLRKVSTRVMRCADKSVEIKRNQMIETFRDFMPQRRQLKAQRKEEKLKSLHDDPLLHFCLSLAGACDDRSIGL
jgi:hypothetical protein